MVIGASGSIGSVSARLLAMAFDEVYIAGRTCPSSKRCATRS
jgi:saccharopine dehydrogenase-like NADP-dependent oxidoreductase